jgi:acyl carrier protein
MEQEELIKFFSEYWNIDKNKIDNDLKLSNESIENFSSIKLYQFFADLESKFNLKITNINKIIVFGDIIKNIE